MQEILCPANLVFARPARKNRDTGLPIPPDVWNRQYRQGAWQFLNSPDELAHYRTVAESIHRRSGFPTILDAGCGHGRLAALLAGGSYRSYLGIDFSVEAIARAAPLARGRVRFQVADLNGWRPTGRYSVIVFCESLNYLIRPAATLSRYAAALTPDGVIVVSLYRHPHHDKIWAMAAESFRTLEASTVSNDRRQRWDVKVLRPLSAEGCLAAGVRIP